MNVDMPGFRIPPALKKGTYTVSFYHALNHLNVVVDVVSVSHERAEAFARQRFNLRNGWDCLSCHKKYKKD